MDRSRIKWTDQDGEHEVELSLLDWVAWEKQTGKSAGKGIDQITDILILCWSAAKREGEKRPFDGFIARLDGLPEVVSTGKSGPTQPGA